MKKLKTREIIKENWTLIKNDFWLYFLNLIVAQVIISLIAKPLTKTIFNFALIQSGVTSITNANFVTVLTNPLSLLTLIIAGLLLTLFIIIELSVIVNFISLAYNKGKPTIKTILYPLKKIKPVDFILIGVYFFLLLPTANIGLSSSITSNLHIPSFIISTVKSNIFGNIIYNSLIIISFYLSIRLFFTAVIFIKENKTFKQSLKKSWVLTKNKSIDILKVLGIQGLIFLLMFLFITFITLLPSALLDNFANIPVKLISSVMQTVFLFLLALITAITVVSTSSLIVVMYNKIIDNKQPTITKRKLRKRNKTLNIIIIIIFIITTVLVYFDNQTTKKPSETLIISHRGESEKAIENTIDSLIIASSYKPDYVEIDIQTTKDNKIIVFHDNTLKRLSNSNKKISDLTLNELKQIKLTNNNNTSSIPTLEEYVKKSKELNQKLLIELKPSTYDKYKYLDNIINILEKYNILEETLFQSLDKDLAITLKNYYPNTKVGYILGINIGGLEDLNVDFYSLEDSSITNKVIIDAKKQKKDLFVWTINTPELMSYYLDMNIKGVITDDISLAIEMKNTNFLTSSFFGNIKKLIEKTIN